MKRGDKVWIIENGSRVTQAEILSISGGLYLIRLETGKSLRLPKHRLYTSREDVELMLPKQGTRCKSPHGWD